MRSTGVLICAALAACGQADDAAPPPSQQAAPSAYAIEGTGRHWRARLSDSRLAFFSPTHAGWYAYPVAAADAATDGGRNYALVGRPSTLGIVAGGCDDPILARTYPDAVRFRHDGADLAACGGEVSVPGANFAAAIWRVASLRGHAAPYEAGAITTLQVGADGRLGGTVACNDAGTEVFFENGGFRAVKDEVMSTAMGCGDEAAVAFGSGAFSALSEAVSVDGSGAAPIIVLAGGGRMELEWLARAGAPLALMQEYHYHARGKAADWAFVDVGAHRFVRYPDRAGIYRGGDLPYDARPGDCGGDSPIEVAVTFGPKRLTGCGGPVPENPPLEDSSWELRMVAQELRPVGSIRFRPDGRLGGTMACEDVTFPLAWRPTGEFAPAPAGGRAVAVPGACGEDARARHRGLLLMEGAQTFATSGRLLTARLADGQTLTFTYLF